MQEQYTLELNRAVDLVLNRDYGQAMYIALKIYVSAAKVNPDDEAKKKSLTLLSNLDRLIEIEFDEFARRKGIKINYKNKKALMRKHSKHWQRFESFMYPGGMEPYGLRYVRVPLTLSQN